jgi:hypothetical protein
MFLAGAEPTNSYALTYALVTAGIGASGTAFGLFINWLRDRDKLRYDSKLQLLETQNATQADQIQALTAQNHECEENSKKLEESHKTLDARVSALEAQSGKKP